MFRYVFGMRGCFLRCGNVRVMFFDMRRCFPACVLVSRDAAKCFSVFFCMRQCFSGRRLCFQRCVCGCRCLLRCNCVMYLFDSTETVCNFGMVWLDCFTRWHISESRSFIPPTLFRSALWHASRKSICISLSHGLQAAGKLRLTK